MDRLERPEQFHCGCTLFYDEDVKRDGPGDVPRFGPAPELVSFR